MKITIDRNQLHGALARIKPAVDRNGQIASTSGVLLTTGPDNLHFDATNLSVQIATSTQAECDQTGEQVLVPFERFTALIGRCPPGNVTLRWDDNSEVDIQAGRIKASLSLMEPSTYPTRHLVVDNETKLDADWQAIQRAIHCRSLDPKSPSLMCMHLSERWATTTDSYRLARHPIALDCDLVLSPEAIESATKAHPQGPVVIRWDDQWYSIEADGTTWSAQRSGETYPTNKSIESMFPKPTVTAAVARLDLLDAIDAANAIGGEQSVDNKGRSYTSSLIEITIDSGGIIVASRGEAGRIEVPLDADTQSGLTVAFQPTFLRAAIAACADDTVTLKGVNPLKPWMLDDGGLQQMVMPVRIAGT